MHSRNRVCDRDGVLTPAPRFGEEFPQDNRCSQADDETRAGRGTRNRPATGIEADEAVDLETRSYSFLYRTPARPAGPINFNR